MTVTRDRGSLPGASTPHPRLAARRRDVRRQRRRRRRRRRQLGLLVFFTLLAVAGMLVALSPLMAVDRITVTGSEAVDAGTIELVSHIGRGDAVVGIDRDAVVARVEALPAVASASVHRSFGGDVEITIIERVPVAVAGTGAHRLLVDREGHLMGVADPATDLPSIGSLRPDDTIGTVVRDHQRHLADILASLPEATSDGLLSITGHADGLGAIRKDGVVVDLGDDTGLRAKFEAVDLVLEQYEAGAVGIVDVRVPNAATVRTTLQMGS